jgi:hypothetical protein
MFNELWWDLIVHCVNSDGIVDHHCVHNWHMLYKLNHLVCDNLYYHNNRYLSMVFNATFINNSVISWRKTRYNHIPNGLIYKAYVNYEHSDGQQFHLYIDCRSIGTGRMIQDKRPTLFVCGGLFLCSMSCGETWLFIVLIVMELLVIPETHRTD